MRPGHEAPEDGAISQAHRGPILAWPCERSSRSAGVASLQPGSEAGGA